MSVTASTTTAAPDTAAMTAAERQPPPPLEKKTFQSLNADVKSLIVEHVIRPSDLQNVCLVSHEMRDIAVRFLYRSVNLDLGSANDTRIAALLSPKNPGLKHVRQFRLYLAHVHDRCNQEQQATFATRMILEFLPDNVLEEFSWCPWRPFSADNLLLLYKKQKRMRWLEVMDLDRPVLEDFKKNPMIEKGLYEPARKLALYPENRETLEMSKHFVEKTAGSLEDLIVHAHFDENDDHSPPRNLIPYRELNDSATAPGLLTSTIFAHMMPFEKCTPFKNLNSLRLHKINLRYCADTWCKFIDFNRIENLRLYHCPGVDTLFGQLSKAAHLPKALKVLEVQHRDNAENEALLALDGFLCLVQGLRDLIIDLQCVRALPMAAGVARHGKHLELLNIHCSSDTSSIIAGDTTDADELVYDSDDFDKICSATTKLEQLSCAFPARSLIRSPDLDWSAYETSLGKLRDLVTLQLSTWPTNKPSTQLLPRSVYEQLLQGLATRIFESLLSQSSTEANATAASSSSSSSSATLTPDSAASTESPPSTLKTAKLRVLAFGIHDKIYERSDSKQQLIYLLSQAIDAEGRPKPYAAPVGWCARQYLEPRSEILDFVLGREAKIPCSRERGEDSVSRLGWDEDDM